MMSASKNPKKTSVLDRQIVNYSGCRNVMYCPTVEIWIQGSMPCYLTALLVFNSTWCAPFYHGSNQFVLFPVKQVYWLKLMQRFLWFIYGKSHLCLLGIFGIYQLGYATLNLYNNWSLQPVKEQNQDRDVTPDTQAICWPTHMEIGYKFLLEFTQWP